MSSVEHTERALATAGVELRPLGDIAELVRGNGMPKAELTDEGVGAIHYGQIYTRYGTWTKSTVSFVAPEAAARLARVEPGNIIITNTSENLEDVGKAVAWLGNEPIVTGGHATVIRHEQDAKYLSYWFQSESFYIQKRALATGTKVIDVSARQLAKVTLPVPPIEVQREIASTLDALSELNASLESGLTEELRKRRQQYGYYADMLLVATANRKVRWSPLGELGTFVRGRRFVNSDFVDDGIPCIHYGELYTHYGLFASETKSHVRPELLPSLRLAQPGDLIVVGGGENVEDVCRAVAWLGESAVAVHDECYIFHHSLNPRYASYVFSSEAFKREKARYARGAKIVRVSIDDLATIEVPVPDMAEQERIVDLLDSYSGFVNQLAADIPAEIVARRKQYAYYRDRLFAFDGGVA